MKTPEPIHLLLVDDLEENLMPLEALLHSNGVGVLKARSGPEALELLLKQEVALAILDVQMPEMDGFELAELMRGSERTKTIPIIFLTAGSFDQQRRFRGYEAGAVDFLHKPLEPDILRAKVGVFLELYRQKRQLIQQRDELKALADENKRLLEESRKHGDLLQEEDRRKDEFLATLAHELRNPLAPIGNGLQIMRMSPGGHAPSEIREMMDRQFTQLVRLIDDLMDVSRIRQGKIELRLEAVDIHSIVRTAVETSRPLIDIGKHLLNVHMPKEPIWIKGDSTRLAQIISNLLNNAAKYTPYGGTIGLTISCSAERIIVEVTDNGLGIPADMLPKIFQLFTQVDRHLERAQGGLGIGLALVRQLVEMHGGTIGANSKGLGKGTTFTVNLPLYLDHVAQKSTVAPKEEPLPTNVLKVLVADDNVPSAKTTGWMLELMGHDYKLVHDGLSAVAIAKQIKPDVILLDIGMPGMSGYEVCRELRKDSQFKNTVLIAQTGWGQEKDRLQAREAGFDHHLTKPIDHEKLSKLLAALPVAV